MEPFGHKPEHEQVEADGDEGIESDGDKQAEDPIQVPVGVLSGLVGGVFPRHDLLHVLPFLLDIPQDIQVGVTAIHENAGLYVVVALLGVVVHVFQALLRHVVIADIVLHLLGVFFQSALDDGGKGQTDAAVGFGLFAHDVRGHGLQAVDQTVIAGYLPTCVADKLAEGQLLALETLVLFRGLMTGIGQVEQVFLLLGVEHQGVLVRLLHGLGQVLEYLLTLPLLLIALVAEFLVVFGQFCAQNHQCRVEIFLFQHGSGLTDHAHHEG